MCLSSLPPCYKKVLILICPGGKVHGKFTLCKSLLMKLPFKVTISDTAGAGRVTAKILERP